MDNEKADIYSVPDGGLPATLDDPAYKAEELIRCERCGRQNGPNRLNCIYCGSALDVGPDAAAVKIELRKPENWEFGWNVVVFPGEQASVRSVEVAAELLQLDSGCIREALGSDAPLPIARLESSREAELLGDRLAALGFQTSVVGDEQLLAGPPHIRLRGLSIVGGNIELRPFNDPRPIAADLSDLSLIITGSIVEARTETIEKRKRRSRETVLELPFVSDEPIIDLYSRGEQAGWRIRSGFDFSCLGNDKQ